MSLSKSNRPKYAGWPTSAPRREQSESGPSAIPPTATTSVTATPTATAAAAVSSPQEISTYTVGGQIPLLVTSTADNQLRVSFVKAADKKPQNDRAAASLASSSSKKRKNRLQPQPECEYEEISEVANVVTTRQISSDPYSTNNEQRSTVEQQASSVSTTNGDVEVRRTPSLASVLFGCFGRGNPGEVYKPTKLPVHRTVYCDFDAAATIAVAQALQRRAIEYKEMMNRNKPRRSWFRRVFSSKRETSVNLPTPAYYNIIRFFRRRA